MKFILDKENKIIALSKDEDSYFHISPTSIYCKDNKAIYTNCKILKIPDTELPSGDLENLIGSYRIEGEFVKPVSKITVHVDPDKWFFDEYTESYAACIGSDIAKIPGICKCKDYIADVCLEYNTLLDVDRLSAWSLVDGIKVIGDGQIRLVCYDKPPEIAIDIVLKEV